MGFPALIPLFSFFFKKEGSVVTVVTKPRSARETAKEAGDNTIVTCCHRCHPQAGSNLYNPYWFRHRGGVMLDNAPPQ
jgi:hypothetical protein